MRLEIDFELPFIARCTADEWQLLMMSVALMDKHNYILFRPIGFTDSKYNMIIKGLVEKNLVHRVGKSLQINRMFVRLVDERTRLRGGVGKSMGEKSVNHGV